MKATAPLGNNYQPKKAARFSYTAELSCLFSMAFPSSKKRELAEKNAENAVMQCNAMWCESAAAAAVQCREAASQVWTQSERLTAEKESNGRRHRQRSHRRRRQSGTITFTGNLFPSFSVVLVSKNSLRIISARPKQANERENERVVKIRIRWCLAQKSQRISSKSSSRQSQS